MTNQDLQREFRSFYKTAKAIAEDDILAFDKDIAETSDSDEREFLTLMTNFFLQKRQQQVINEGLF